MNTKIKIVTDSSSDIISLSDIDFASAPLKIITAQKEYIDDAELDVKKMTLDLRSYNGKSSTSCPNMHDWLRAFGDAEEIFCVTITSHLSGSYNSACLAKTSYEKSYPGRRVCVIDSLSTGPEIALIVERIRKYALEGLTFDEICEKINEYKNRTGLLFVLESLRNLANNGRVSPVVAKVAGLLGIRLVGRASDEGELEPLDKCRGEARAIDAIMKRLREFGDEIVTVRIAHCFNRELARKLTELITAAFPDSDVQSYPCRGLCSFYAERGGLLIGFERKASDIQE